ncbi:hypothetical protein [Massilia sp. DWR3-1-1]|uniref:hypothetical protein n=1 Tax=Massilia sp. DWR3-1-1 TaxID=2804559 RepID=UPI003CF1FA82
MSKRFTEQYQHDRVAPSALRAHSTPDPDLPPPGPNPDPDDVPPPDHAPIQEPTRPAPPIKA